MNRSLRHSLPILVLAALTGCAGGWRGGTIPAQWADAGDASSSSANTTARPAGDAAGATHATADGVRFVWTGEGRSVNVAGEFNAWSTSADGLKKGADGRWTLEKKLAPGKYAYKFVIDGTNWKPDPGVADGVDDGFGAKNSVVTVGAGGPPAAAAPLAAAVGGGPAVNTNGVVFRYTGTANTVNVAGEFNNWSTSADAMTKGTDGVWTLTKKLATGRYQYKFVVDGSNWKEDPNAAQTVDDGYGGKNALVVVGDAPAPTPAPAAPAAPAAGKGAGPAVTADGVVFRYAGTANTVNVAGEFNSWSTSADAMTKGTDGVWTLTKKLAAGKYQYKFVVDGGNWKEDPDAGQTADDGYGGKNAVVEVGGAPAGTGAAPAARAVPAPSAASRPLAPGVKPAAPRVTPAGVVFTFAGAAKSSVSLCGDFNAWATTVDPMTQQADGTWTITKKLAPGTYAYKFLVDGSGWKTDEGNAASRDDGFGGKNSILVVN